MHAMRFLLFFLLSLATAAGLSAQVKLHDQNFTWRTVERFDAAAPEATDNAVLLRMAYASAKIRNPEAWNAEARAGKIPYAVELIFTKYPFDSLDWITPYDRLMPDRMRALYAIDPSLKRADVLWELVAQTGPKTGRQAKQYFHGLRILYMPAPEPSSAYAARAESPADSALRPTPEPVDAETKTVPKSDPFSELKKKYAAKERERAEEQQAARMDGSRTGGRESDDRALDPADMLPPPGFRGKRYNDRQYIMYVRQHMGKIDSIINGKYELEDSTVYRSLDYLSGYLKKQKNDSLRIAVVMDWTGSMYDHGAQVISWHMRHLEQDLVDYLTIFNDGDDQLHPRMRKREKPVGNTDGVYFTEPDKIKDVLDQMEEVMLNGAGGPEAEENDLEAVVKTIERYPGADKIILIADADKWSYVRDLYLLKQIDRPVFVVPCQHDEFIQPDYLNIAWRTRGGIILPDEPVAFEEDAHRIIPQDRKFKIGGVKYKYDRENDKFYIKSRRIREQAELYR